MKIRPTAMVIMTLLLAPYRKEFYVRLAERLKHYGIFFLVQKAYSEEARQWKTLSRNSRLTSKLQIYTGNTGGLLSYPCDPATNFKSTIFIGMPTWKELSFLIKTRPKAIFLHESSFFIWIGYLYAKFMNRPIIFETDIGPNSLALLPLFKRWNHLLLRKTASLVLAKTVDASRMRPATFCPHAVSTSEYRPKPKKNFKKLTRILFVGNPNQRKGVDLLAKALGEMNAEFEAELEIAGSSVEQACEVRRMVRESGFIGKLKILSFLEGKKLIQQYQQADIFVLPSRFDTYGVVVHEAAACGLPLVVSSRAGAAENMVIHGYNGFVVDPEDVAQFATALAMLVKNKQLRVTMGKRSRKIAEKFDVTKQAHFAAKKIKALIQASGLS